LLASIFYVLRLPVVALVEIERVVGKAMYCVSFRQCMRSLLFGVYKWIDYMRHSGRVAGVLWPDAWAELYFVAILVPFMSSDLDADWCTRVSVTDAAPGGHGRAWSTMPAIIVSDLARYGDCKAPYVSASLEHCVALDEKGRCPLARVRLPADVWWTTVARPGGHALIMLEEAEATLWSMEDRCQRPAERGTRNIEFGDNAASVGSLAKGRSANRALNGKCRRSMCYQLAGDYTSFFLWTPTDRNPADTPSRVYATGKSAKALLPSVSEDVLFSLPPGWANGPRVFVCIWPAAGVEGGFAFWLRQYNENKGCNVKVICFGSGSDGPGSLCKVDVLRDLCAWAASGRVVGVLAGPPGATSGRARHRHLADGRTPRPLRIRTDFFEGIGDLTTAERSVVQAESYLVAACIYIVGLVGRLGGWYALVHPEDSGAEPYPSLFATAEACEVAAATSGHHVHLHQCCFGASSVKPTQILCNAVDLRALQCYCRHRGGHPYGGTHRDAGGYPQRLNQQLAASASLACVSDRTDHGLRTEAFSAHVLPLSRVRLLGLVSARERPHPLSRGGGGL
jgi:hypothetical protein